MKTSGIVILILVCVLYGSASAVISFDDSVAWWKIDYASSGPLTNPSHVADSQPNPSNMNGLNEALAPQWVAAPTTGSSSGQALHFTWLQSAVGVATYQDKLAFTGATTVFTRIQRDPTSSYSGVGDIVSRRKIGGGYAGSQWSVYNFRDNGIGFIAWGSDGTNKTAQVALANPAVEPWLNVFGVFDPGNSVSIYIYDMAGNLVGSDTQAVTFLELNMVERHTAIGGRFESDYWKPTCYSPGAIESVAIWNGVLGADDMQHVMMIPEPATITLLGLATVGFLSRKQKR